jgi:hypothetical protein
MIRPAPRPDNRAAQPVLKREVFHFIMKGQEASLTHDVAVKIDINIGFLP